MALLTKAQQKENKYIITTIMEQSDYQVWIERENEYAGCIDMNTKKPLFDNRYVPFRDAFEVWCTAIGIAPF